MIPQFFNSSTPANSYVLSLNGSSNPSFQLSVSGSAAVSASAVVDGSHDGQGWIPIVTLTASGTPTFTYARGEEVLQ